MSFGEISSSLNHILIEIQDDCDGVSASIVLATQKSNVLSIAVAWVVSLQQATGIRNAVSSFCSKFSHFL